MKLVPVAFCLLLVGCGTRAAPTGSPAPAEKPQPRSAAPGGEALAAGLKNRLPGERSLSLLRVMRWASRTPGPCTADFAPGAGDTAIDLAYETKDEKRSLRDAGIEALTSSGWTVAYRTPAGIGFDLPADFRSIDLSMRQKLECRCFGAKRAVAAYPTSLRFRWSEGKLPEASAAVERDGRSEGLRVAVTAGHLLTYAFEADEAFPGGRAGKCSAHLEVSALVDPPLR
jgi:hypothetical protein